MRRSIRKCWELSVEMPESKYVVQRKPFRDSGVSIETEAPDESTACKLVRRLYHMHGRSECFSLRIIDVTGRKRKKRITGGLVWEEGHRVIFHWNHYVNEKGDLAVDDTEEEIGRHFPNHYARA